MKQEALLGEGLMRKVGIFYSTFVFIFVGITNPSFANAEEREHPSLAFNYILIDSSVSNETVTQRYNLEIQNASSKPIYDVRAILRKVPNYVTIIDREISFGHIAPGEIKTGANVFSIAINLSKQPASTVDVTWEIIYKDINGENEVLVYDKLELNH